MSEVPCIINRNIVYGLGQQFLQLYSNAAHETQLKVLEDEINLSLVISDNKISPSWVRNIKYLWTITRSPYLLIPNGHFNPTEQGQNKLKENRKINKQAIQFTGGKNGTRNNEYIVKISAQYSKLVNTVQIFGRRPLFLNYRPMLPQIKEFI